MPFNLNAAELIVILVIALLILGPGKLPEVGSALGRSIREFRKATSDVQESAAPLPPQAAAAQQPPAAPAPAAPTPAATVPATAEPADKQG